MAVAGGTGNAWAPHKQQERSIDWSLQADFGSMVAAIGAWRTHGSPGVRGSARLPAGLLRRRLQHPPDRRELRVGDWQMQAALSWSGVRLAPRPRRLAAQQRRYTEQRIADRGPH
jgi:hypothetical protein